jgi:ArsR family transcriptional regulator
VSYAGHSGQQPGSQSNTRLTSSLISTFIDIDLAPYIDACQYRDVKTLPQLEATCCGELLGTLRSEDADELARRLKALADPGRLRLLNAIASRPSGEACVCELTAPIGLSQPTVSHHLKVLHEAGLLARERRGTWIYYRVVTDSLEAITDALSPRAGTLASIST